jgi:glycosyltransferase involved in cell wall biosynthesis
MRPSRTEHARPHPLILVDTLEIGGTGKGVLQLARGLRARGVAVTLANFRYEGRPSAFTTAATDAGLDLVELEQSHRLDASCIRRLAAEIRARGCNVLESHSFKVHLVAWRLRSQLGLPWAAHAHGWTRETRRVLAYNAIERRLLKRPEHVCVVSPQLEADVLAAGRTLPLTVLRNGIEPGVRGLTPQERRAAREALGIDADAKVYSAIGRLSREKGLDVLVEAVARHGAAIPHLRVYVAGQGPELARLRQFAAERGVEAIVHFLGQVRDVRRLMAASDAVVLPSRSEGVPNVALEALDAGVPLVATQVGTLPEMIVHERTGWLVPPGDPDALGHALQRVAALDGAALARMGELGRVSILPRFSAARRVERVIEIYETLLGGTIRERTSPVDGAETRETSRVAAR